jgi:L-ribulose-5-phosphate 4-epimerase
VDNVTIKKVFAAPETVQETKEKVAQAMRILTSEGILSLNLGHASAKIPGTEQICIVGHIHEEGRDYFEVRPEDIVIIDYEGNMIEGEKAPGERFVHTEVYKRRPDVGAIVHAHPLYSTAFGIAGVPIKPVYYRGSIFAPEVPIMDYGAQIDTKELGARMAETLGDAFAVLMRNHGHAVVGRTMEEACIATFALERTAQLQYMANMLGGARPLPPSEIDGKYVKGYNQDIYFHAEWTYWERKDPWHEKPIKGASHPLGW